MTDPIEWIAGMGGELKLFPDRVVIKRKGIIEFLRRGGKLPIKEIPLTNIASIEFQEASLLVQGYIDFAHSGQQDSKEKDAYKVNFMKREQQLFYDFKEKVFELLKEQKQR